MTGKIFKDSTNIYEDEAKILFDYYKKAAEKIVGEEIDLENKISSTQTDKAEAVSSLNKWKILTWVFCWTIIMLIVGLVKQNGLKKRIADDEEKIQAFTDAKNDIRRDYKVSKMGVAYVPVATRVPFEGKSFVVDHTGGMPDTDFSLSVLRQPKELQKSLAELENGISSVPVVEGNEDAEQIDTSNYSKSIQTVTIHDYMGNIDRQVRNISYLLNDADKKSVSLPVIPPASQEDRFIDEFATTDVNGKPVVKVFNTDGFADKLENFTQINEMKKELEKNSGQGEDNSEYFKKLIRKLGDTVQLVSKAKTNSTSKLLDYTNSIFAAVLKAGCNQYSPKLEEEELARIRDMSFNYEECVENYRPFELKASSRVKYDIYNRAWTSEDGAVSPVPFGMNQVEEEVLMPLINNLMMETRVERLKIYSSIKDQKLSYLNKWHQDVEAAFRDNRKSGQDLITQITNAYAEYATAHNTYLSYKQTQDSMKYNGLAGSETQEISETDSEIQELESKVNECKETGDAFQAYMSGLQADINASSEKFGFVQYYEASLRDTESKNIAWSIMPENIQNLDPRRQRLVSVNTYYAANAPVPPVPSVEQELIRDFTMNLSQVASDQLSRIEYETSEEMAETQQDEPAEQADSAEQTAEPQQADSAGQTEQSDQTENSSGE